MASKMTEKVHDAPAGPLRSTVGRCMLCKVPEITLYFWIIKILCTTVGESFADLLNETVGLGLAHTTYIMGSMLIVSLALQFYFTRYVVPVYWSTVVLISVVGTLLTDNLTDNAGVQLWISSVAFAAALAVIFALWWAVERTLSVHSIFTTRREIFYWLTILFTFALGTAVGDLVAEKGGLGYAYSALLWAGVIAVIAIVHRFLKGPSVLCFWAAYILTRPLGASLGDLLAQERRDGGLDLGTLITSMIFLAAILLVVVYLMVSRADIAKVTAPEAEVDASSAPSASTPAKEPVCEV